MGFRKFVKIFIPSGLFPKIEPYGHLGEAVILNTLNGFPARRMKVIGVTGTNGKTSTCFLIYKMLHTAGYKVGLMTTVAYGAGDDIKPQLTHMTSQTVPVLMRRLKMMQSKGVEWLVLETTSQALAQNRVWGVPYSIAVMSNVTHEHLSWHKTFERYRAAKVKLFQMTDRNHQGLRIGILNADDPSAKYFAKAIKNPISYGIEKGAVRAKDVQLLPDGIQYSTEIEGKTYHIKSHLPGSFNVSNSLATVCVGHALGLSEKQIEQGIWALESVEGRMTRIEEGQKFTAIVDYAHTPDSFEKLFKDLRPVVKSKLIVVFGSLGGGDKNKRPLQGQLAGKYADEVIICEEDDRQEDPETIMNDIAVGAELAGKVRGKDLFLIHDRPKAMQSAVDHADTGDTVLFLGKGHEKTIEHADGEHPWDEIGMARKALKKRLAKH
ncbi:MAG TPA: UDP-N-acetylmuramyl-tripeptide synthetase [Candidatus Saccharimonadales bacterium]|nr:UDP-N-acetylmuramyl-tripeptide synthetase [Candidatus Saccharimonadales bacterium]